MVLNILVLGALVFKLLHVTTAYNINYYDCYQPKPGSIREYNIDTFCTTQQTSLKPTRRYHVLQRRKEVAMRGYSCEIIRSTFVIHCGMFSHSEVIAIPDIELKQMVTLRECQTMVTTGEWTAADGSKHKVKIGAERVIHVSEKGILHAETNNIYCEGEDLKINGHIIPGVLKMTQYRIIINRENYIVRKKHVEALDSHVSLPTGCTVEKGGCVVHKTYLWNPPSTMCPMVKINHGEFTQEEGWLVEHKAKLLFKVTDTSQSPIGCPSGEILHTEYEDLFLTVQDDFPHLGKQVDISLYVKQSSDYVMFETERLTNRMADYSSSQLCKQIYNSQQEQIIPMGANMFGKRAGDIIYTFTCIERQGKLLSSAQCFDRIPLQGELFIDPMTRVATKHATVKPCNKLFPQAIKTIEGWVSLPEMKNVKKPKDYYLIGQNMTHEDLSGGGLYTKEELDHWERLISYGTFHSSLLSSLSTGVCTQRAICDSPEGSTVPAYDLANLISEVETKMDPLSALESWIRTNGAYLAFLVMFVWTLKLALWLALISGTLFKEGKNVAVALVYATCCGALYRSGRIKRHNMKKGVATPDETTDFIKYETSTILHK